MSSLDYYGIEELLTEDERADYETIRLGARQRFTTTQAGMRLSRVPVEPAPDFSHSAGRMNRGLELFRSATFFGGFKKAFASKLMRKQRSSYQLASDLEGSCQE